MALIPPTPVGGQFGSYTWQDWYEKVRRAINTATTITWSQITNFAGSNLTNLVTRNHNDLQTIQGGTAGQYYHLTSAEQGALATRASTTQTTETISGYIETVANKTYKIVTNFPHGGTITSVTTICDSGTCTLTTKINTTALGGTPNSVSVTQNAQAQASSNVFAATDSVSLVASANASCLGMTVTIKYTRTLS